MKYIGLLILILLSYTGPGNEKPVMITPKPGSVITGNGYFRMKKTVSVFFMDNEASSLFGVFSNQVREDLSLHKVDSQRSDIIIKTEPGMGNEGYSLQVEKNSITISASSVRGAFYGFQSLRELIIFSDESDNIRLIPCCTIKDSPRFAWRGIMLDESRHFFGPQKVRQLIDLMALHKLNSFHWHLTDVPGWRVEIRKYPLLTTVGGTGNHTDKLAPAKYYTRDQIKEIVQYASERFIQIIPEIDMPGHAGASNRAYPEFSGGGSKTYPEFTFNPGKEGTYSYLTDILKEIAEMFPAPYIHLGGDEVSFGNQEWNNIPGVRSLMIKYDLADLKAVEKYFVRRMSDTIKSLNKITIGWDEITDMKINPRDAIIMWWRQDKKEQLNTALKEGYRVVLCPRIPLYFDFVQDAGHKVGRRMKNVTCNLENVYNFPPDTLTDLAKYKNQVLGFQANIWTEQIGDEKRLDYMTFPRLTALAEAAWTGNKNKNYSDFLIRLKPFLTYLKKGNIYYYDPFNPEITPEPAGPVRNN